MYLIKGFKWLIQNIKKYAVPFFNKLKETARFLACCSYENFSSKSFLIFRENCESKEVKKPKIEKKPPHAVSNRALSNVVSGLNNTVELSTDTQDDGEEHTSDDIERYYYLHPS